ncbi:hypothetical protein A2617_00490 [Candidatus Daviesbacteria bacterium RIFOXYD1_FULL_41_10]|uniref:Type II toxin-antitoxin system mRNA interferase toxin, RelE/StbE family n=1 Tax=Candidatus Daviesbacteria bacterium RIFOXYD1_FULL_41_10 TaxID=1797801 RepID=A0A1F5N0A3_9BACT|nr:MAG: hypothetical protein A2617_00490 [Candidatus Daviesbacteria bacterium RIFOXYD1_FULL_41_10]
MFLLNFTVTFNSHREKVFGSNKALNKRLKVTLIKLATNPTHPSLHSHKVSTLTHGQRWSSSVTGDIRIIWDYDSKNRLIILLLDIGSHSGTHKVYK